MKYAALVLTHNEADNIAACLLSLRGARRVVVLDSGSTDGTREYVGDLGGRVELVERPFDSFAGQRNHGLETCFEPDEWVLHLDADERVTRKLHAEIAALRPPDECVAYNVASLTWFRGRPVPRASAFPVYQTRLTRAGAFRFVEVGHGQKAPRELGALPRLRNPYRHDPISKGLADWMARHNRYSTLEAEERLRGGGGYRLREAVRDPIAARQAAKALSYRLPCRALLIYWWLLFVRGGILEGEAGRDFCRLRYLYESMIDLKVREMRAGKR